jgi:hypothetical protein
MPIESRAVCAKSLTPQKSFHCRVDLASTTVFAAAIGAASKSPEAAPRLKAKGFTPAIPW